MDEPNRKGKRGTARMRSYGITTTTGHTAATPISASSGETIGITTSHSRSVGRTRVSADSTGSSQTEPPDATKKD